MCSSVSFFIFATLRFFLERGVFMVVDLPLGGKGVKKILGGREYKGVFCA